MEYPVFKAECVLAVRGARDAHRDAGVALARLAASGLFGICLMAFPELCFGQWFEFETIQFGEGLANIGMVSDITDLDLLDDQRLDRFLDLFPVAEIEHRFDHAFAGRFLRADPARASIPVVSKRVEIGLRPRWRGVERAVAVKFDARNQEMQLNISQMPMAHPENISLIPLKPRKGGFLEIGHHRRLIRFGGIVVGMEGHDAASVAPCPAIAVDQGAGQVGVA